MNRAALTLGMILVVAVSLFVGGFGFAFFALHRDASGLGIDEAAFRQEFGDVNLSAPVYGFSPPVPMYRALKLALEEGGWNRGSLRNMTVKVSLDYFEFTENVTFAEGNHTLLSNGSYRIGEVTQPVDSYAPVIIQSATNGTIAYRYIWDIGIVNSNGLLSIPPPGLYWVDAATAEMVSTGILI